MREKFIYLLEIVLLVFIVVSRAFYYSNIDDKLESQSSEAKANQEKVMYNTIVTQIDTIGVKLKVIKDDNFLEQGILKTRIDIMNNLSMLRENIDSISALYVAFENGQCYGSYDNRMEFNGIEIEDWYVNTKRNNDLVLTGKKTSDMRYVGVLSLPLIDDEGKFYGVIAAEIDENIFRDVIKTFEAYIEQIILKDKNGNSFYVYDKTAKISSSDPVSYIFNSENRYGFLKNSIDFDIEIYYTYEKISIIKSLVQPLDAIILSLFLALVIFKVIRTKQLVDIDKIMLRANMFLIFELGLTFFLIVGERTVGANNHSEILRRYENIIKESCHEITDIVYEDVKDDIIYDLEESLINEKLINLKNEIQNLNTIFYIDFDGNYKAYPMVNDETLKNLNFETNRKLLNGKEKDSFYQIYDFDDFSTYVGTKKIVDSNGKYIGTVGVNIKLERLYDFAKRLYNKQNLNYKIEIDEDGIINKVYYSGKKEKLNLNMSKENKNKLSNEYGVIVERTQLIGKRYVFFKSYGGDKKYLLEISFESTDGIYKIIKSAAGILGVVFITILVIRKLNRECINRKVDLEKEIIKNVENLRKEDEERKAEDKDLIKKIRIFEKSK